MQYLLECISFTDSQVLNMRISIALFLLFLSAGFHSRAQQASDACITATPICPSTTYSGSNFGASATVCPGCEDDFTFCFSGSNSVWYQFTTNVSGGDVNFTFSNILFNPVATRGTALQAAIIEAQVPCDAATFTQIGNCEAAGIGTFNLSATGLPANSTYYLVVNGAQNGGATLPAEATFDLIGSGSGFDRPVAGISIFGPTFTICPETPTTFNVYLSNCTDTSAFTWLVNGVPKAVTEINFWQTSALQTGDVISVTCTCFDICKDTLTAILPAITIDPLTVDAGNDVVIQLGESTQLVGISNGIDFSWSPSQTLNTPFSISTFATPEETTTYTLTAMNANCSLSDEVTVFITNNLEIPGSFSPNGDGHNDRWIIQGIEYYPDAQVIIYDRWGQQITNISGYSPAKAWDGMFKGKPVSDGVYFYSLDLRQNNDTKPLKGSVTVIR